MKKEPPEKLSGKTSEQISIECEINGRNYTFSTLPMVRLLDVLREEAKLTGTKEGCGEGECGACSVFVNNELVNSCLIPAAQIHGAKIKTIEGVASQDQLHSIQKAFLQTGGAQCGICTPGMILASLNLLSQSPHPTDEEIREGLAGNICRCTGYMKIFDAVRTAAAMAPNMALITEEPTK